MKIESSDFCDNKKCILHSETENKTIRYGTTYIKLDLTGEEDTMNIPIPCLLCSNAKKLDFEKILSKLTTTVMLKK